MVDSDRIERTLESLRDSVMTVREAIAAMSSQLETWKETSISTQAALAVVRADLSRHAEQDASLISELRAEMKRLWWGAGIVLTAVVAGVVTLSMGIK
jgi:hypothetical protein